MITENEYNFCLSEFISLDKRLLREEDVKEFIRKLKDEIDTTFALLYGDVIVGKYTIKRKLDLEKELNKLAGEALI